MVELTDYVPVPGSRRWGETATGGKLHLVHLGSEVNGSPASWCGLPMAAVTPYEHEAPPPPDGTVCHTCTKLAAAG